jgi:hypothetical protein
MDENELEKKLDASWERYLRENEWWKPSDVRVLMQNNLRFDVYFNLSKVIYYGKERGKLIVDDKFGRRFDKSLNNFEYDNFIGLPSITPIIERHYIFIPRENRAFMKAEDLKSLINFSRESGYKVFINLKGSGASIPDQFHAQAGPFFYPLLDSDHGFKYEDVDEYFSRFHEPHYGMRLDTSKLNGQFDCALLRLEKLQNSEKFNIAIKGDLLYTFPRTQETAFANSNWQFAGQEMCGIYCTRSKEVFANLKHEDVQSGLKSVTLTNLARQREFEEKIRV